MSLSAEINRLEKQLEAAAGIPPFPALTFGEVFQAAMSMPDREQFADACRRLTGCPKTFDMAPIPPEGDEAYLDRRMAEEFAEQGIGA